MAKGNEGPDTILVHRTAEGEVGYYLGEEIKQGQSSYLFKREGELTHEGDIEKRGQITYQGPNEISQITGSYGGFVHIGDYTGETCLGKEKFLPSMVHCLTHHPCKPPTDNCLIISVSFKCFKMYKQATHDLLRLPWLLFRSEPLL